VARDHQGVLVRFVGRRLAAVLVALSTLAALATAPSVADETEQLRDELERARAELEDAAGQLGGVRGQVEATQAALQAIDAQLAAATAQLAALEEQLVQARAAEHDAARRTQRVTRRLEVATAALEDALEQLHIREDLLSDRAAAQYKHGPISYVDVMVSARSFDELLHGTDMVRFALAYDSALIVELDALVTDTAARRADVDRLRDEAASTQVLARRSRREIAGLADEQRRVTQNVAADRNERAAVLDALESDQAHYEALVADLQAESDTLARELSESTWYAGAAPGAGELLWPTDGPPGSGYGWRTHPIFGTQRFHAGVDIAGPTGQAIVAAATGVVAKAGWYGGYGQATVIDHGGGLSTLYGHQSSLYVSAGDFVVAGQTIGAIGSTGYSTGPHLHFEVRVNGAPQDPMRWY
jgi:murein DD-endopeptidase MepM/ murein hydrolase activator NlpD